MDDAKFLQQCGIEIDPRWLVEFMHQEAPLEICTYLKGLIRIADILSNVQVHEQIGE
jgi:hypothetical protein